MKGKPLRTKLTACTRCGSLVEVPDGAALREVRKAAGLTLRAFADRVGMSPAYISDIELDRRRLTPKLEMVYQSLCVILTEAQMQEICAALSQLDALLPQGTETR